MTARNSRSRGLGLGAGKMLSLSCRDWDQHGASKVAMMGDETEKSQEDVVTQG